MSSPSPPQVLPQLISNKFKNPINPKGTGADTNTQTQVPPTSSWLFFSHEYLPAWQLIMERGHDLSVNDPPVNKIYFYNYTLVDMTV